jgi:hypothetical protein
MPKKSKLRQQPPKQSSQTGPSKESSDREQYLIDKIAKCQRIVGDLRNNPIWEEIKRDFEITAQSLDISWAYEDGSGPRFKQMQVAKMAVQTFMNLLPNYEHDLELARKELHIFSSPKEEVKKDYDDEGVKETQTISTAQGNAYHG